MWLGWGYGFGVDSYFVSFCDRCFDNLFQMGDDVLDVMVLQIDDVVLGLDFFV